MANPTKPKPRAKQLAVKKTKAKPRAHVVRELNKRFLELVEKRSKKENPDLILELAWLKQKPLLNDPEATVIMGILDHIDPLTDPEWQHLPVRSNKWRRQLFKLRKELNEAAETVDANCGGSDWPTIEQVNNCVAAAKLLRDRMVITLAWLQWAHVERLLTDKQLTAANFD